MLNKGPVSDQDKNGSHETNEIAPSPAGIFINSPRSKNVRFKQGAVVPPEHPNEHKRKKCTIL